MENKLTVYGTRGQEYYPDPESRRRAPEAARWFDDGLRFSLDTSEPKVMVYLGDVRHPRRTDQAFAVYRGRDPKTVLSECRRDVQGRLCEGEGWEILEERRLSNPRFLYRAAVQATEDGNRPPTRTLSEYVDYDREFLESVLARDNGSSVVEPLEVVVNDYQIAAEFVHGYLHEYDPVPPITVTVYNDRETNVPPHVDLAVKVETGPQDVVVPTRTRELLSRCEQQLHEHRRKKREEEVERTIEKHYEEDGERALSTAIESALAVHDERGGSPEEVESALKGAFDGRYSSLRVVRQGKFERLRTERDEARETVRKRESALQDVRSQLETERQRVRRLERRVNLYRAGEGFRNRLAALVGYDSRGVEDEGPSWSHSGSDTRLDGSGGSDRTAIQRSFEDTYPDRGSPTETLLDPKLLLGVLLAGVLLSVGLVVLGVVSLPDTILGVNLPAIPSVGQLFGGSDAPQQAASGGNGTNTANASTMRSLSAALVVAAGTTRPRASRRGL